MKALILAGGRGSRLGQITNHMPKPLVRVGGKPIIVRQIEELKRNGFDEIYVSVGYLSQKIINFLGNGSDFGVKIKYFIETAPLGSGGPLYFLKQESFENMLVISGDLLFKMDLGKLFQFHESKKAIVTLTVHQNDHPLDSDLVEINENNKIVKFYFRPHPSNIIFQNLVNASVTVINKQLLKYVEDNKFQKLEKDVFYNAFKDNQKLYAYKTREYIRDLGTVERIKKAEYDLKNGIYDQSLEPIPAIFIDRDGVINKEIGGVVNIKDFELLPNVISAISLINASKFLAIIITNQPAVAKGFCSYSDVVQIHKYLETLLGRKGVYVNEIYFCPHHPEKGFPGENKEYKIVCDCRKPKIGLIKRAVDDYKIDLSKSWFIGDSTRDIMTAKNAGIKSICVKTGYGCDDKKFNIKPDLYAKDLYAAIDFVLKND